MLLVGRGDWTYLPYRCCSVVDVDVVVVVVVVVGLQRISGSCCGWQRQPVPVAARRRSSNRSRSSSRSSAVQCSQCSQCRAVQAVQGSPVQRVQQRDYLEADSESDTVYIIGSWGNGTVDSGTTVAGGTDASWDQGVGSQAGVASQSRDVS